MVLGAGAAWLYFPPIGTTVALPELEPLLEPVVRHGKPVFIQAGDHVYYRVRLHEPVSPTFGSDHFHELLRRGVQFKEETTSPHRFFQRRTGWKVAMAREATTDPYTIEYWTARDSKTPWNPVQLRWPWLYVRFGIGVLVPKTAVIVPDIDATPLPDDFPRYPGSVLRDAIRTRELVQLHFVARASRQELVRYYAWRFKAKLIAGESTVWFSLPDEVSLSLSRPDNIHVDVPPHLFTDEPLLVYTPEAAESLQDAMFPKQPTLLQHLPRVSAYVFHLRYASETEARRPWRSRFRSRPESGSRP